MQKEQNYILWLGNNTRPTLDRVKESLFNIIQNRITNSVFLDLFSGSGAIGIEAVSRGAKKAILCEKEIKAIQIIKKNIEKTHFEDKIELYYTSFDKLLRIINKKEIDIIYIDPPYRTDYSYEATKLILNEKILKDDGLIIIETDEPNRVIKQISNLNINIIDQRKYGRANLIFLKMDK